jgi:hypothetical protein
MGAAGFIEITSNDNFGGGDVWDSSGSAANVAAAMSNASLPVPPFNLQPLYIKIGSGKFRAFS